MKKETWVDIKGFEDLYQVSDSGKVRSKNRSELNSLGYLRNYKQKELKSKYNKVTGYNYIILYKNNKGYTFSIHRLVALNFLEKDNFNIVNHKNGNKTDNRVENLEWCDTSHNHKHAFDIGLRDRHKSSRLGSDNSNAKLTEDNVLKIVSLIEDGSFSIKEIASMFNIHWSIVYKIKAKKVWKHVTVKAES
jgi:hypothetical protein